MFSRSSILKWKCLIKSSLIIIASIVILLNGLPEKKNLRIPVVNATNKNWDAKSFWYYPWGNAGIHKGIDIFAPQSTPIRSPVDGLVIDKGYSANGGNYIYILGPRLRIYYFAHLNKPSMGLFKSIKVWDILGEVGNSGNAIGRPHHLHFSIFSLAPIIRHFKWKEKQGWKKMFYLDPNNLLIDK